MNAEPYCEGHGPQDRSWCPVAAGRAVPAPAVAGNRVAPMTGESTRGYPGESLGLPQTGSGSLAPLGRRLGALLVDWLIAAGLALLAMAVGAITVKLARPAADWPVRGSSRWWPAPSRLLRW